MVRATTGGIRGSGLQQWLGVAIIGGQQRRKAIDCLMLVGKKEGNGESLWERDGMNFEVCLER